jgi:formylglycine-generating enzyme required for sulfatase activity
MDPAIEISAGKEYSSFEAPKELNSKKLIQDFLNLKKSNDPQDILKFIVSSRLVSQLEKLGLYRLADFSSDLAQIASDSRLVFQARKAAVLEFFLLATDTNNPVEIKFEAFTETERSQITSECKQWIKSSDPRKKNFANSIVRKWLEAVKISDKKLMGNLLDLKLVDVNSKNEKGYTGLIIAVQNRSLDSIEYLLSNPSLIVTDQDAKGFTALDHALVLGHGDIARMIESRRPESKQSLRRKDFGSVYQSMIFNRIEPGEFMMGPGNGDKLTKITKRFDLMSTPVTQKMWVHVMGKNPSLHVEGEGEVKMKVDNSIVKLLPDHPVEHVSYDEVKMFISRLNRLSVIGDPLLYQLIPDHKAGEQFRLPTLAEWEFVVRNRGRSNEVYNFGWDVNELDRSAWIVSNSKGESHAVGLKDPLMVDGKAFYDMYGNVWEFVSDVWGKKSEDFKAGPDTRYTVSGGAWDSSPFRFSSGTHSHALGGQRLDTLGFRLVRIVEP